VHRACRGGAGAWRAAWAWRLPPPCLRPQRPAPATVQHAAQHITQGSLHAAGRTLTRHTPHSHSHSELYIHTDRSYIA
jgi:hypothetical protein